MRYEEKDYVMKFVNFKLKLTIIKIKKLAKTITFSEVGITEIIKLTINSNLQLHYS